MLINAVMGTLVAWVLVRDEFPGKRIIDSLIDLPFALPTIVTGLTLLALYGPRSPFGINIAYQQVSILIALLFVTLPFMVRSVQPVLLELDRDMEEAAASLGASPFTVIRRIVLPNLVPAILTGGALGFARCMGEFGSVVLISGNIPLKTEVSSVYIKGLIEGDRARRRGRGVDRAAGGVAGPVDRVRHPPAAHQPTLGGRVTAASSAAASGAHAVETSGRQARVARLTVRTHRAGLPGAAARAAGRDGLRARLRGRHRAGAPGDRPARLPVGVLADASRSPLITVPVCTVFGVITALAIVRRRFPGRSLLNALVDLPFALSPVVIGLSLFLVYGSNSPIGGFLADNGITVIFAVPGMVLATIFVCLPFVIREVVPVLREIGTDQEEAAYTLGAGSMRTFWRVTLPAIRWGIMYGVILTTARSLGEFGAVAIVSGKISGKTITLTTHVQERYEAFDIVGAYTASIVLATHGPRSCCSACSSTNPAGCVGRGHPKRSPRGSCSAPCRQPVQTHKEVPDGHPYRRTQQALR